MTSASRRRRNRLLPNLWLMESCLRMEPQSVLSRVRQGISGEFQSGLTSLREPVAAFTTGK